MVLVVQHNYLNELVTFRKLSLASFGGVVSLNATMESVGASSGCWSFDGTSFSRLVGKV